MPNKMLIDATHPEETRVVVLRGNRVEEFDFESANRKQLRGNIYLAKVTRVEPSLQAAFVDYGGNRHGFLAFSEIHPDYYQIPIADRQALIAEEERAQRAAEAEADLNVHQQRHRGRAAHRRSGQFKSEPLEEHEADPETGATEADSEQSAASTGPEPSEESSAQSNESGAASADHLEPDLISPVALGGDSRIELAQLESSASAEPVPAASDGPQLESGFDRPTPLSSAEEAQPQEGQTSAHAEDRDVNEAAASEGSPEAALVTDREHNVSEVNGGEGEEEHIESVGGADAMEEVPERMPRLRRQYKIQEVIKRRQVMLVQVVKEERGTKGAALTTYLSLAGRYSVLMPNTARGGGISRKITSAEDRRRLKEIAQELEVPEGMGVILRTAGAARTKTEVKRDFEYLLRLWETVRDLTLKSTAPTLVYEEGSLVKRSIRDLYNKDIDEILVAGGDAYHEAKEFMRMLMPSHTKGVKLYQDALPMFTRHGIESQLDAMFTPVMQLRSGGYIVINQAEALVAIDVNSGRATREHHIEDTALKTNLEAAEEIARQLRLRDLAGLIVIDFIDMDEKRNNRAVERRLKECLRHDRARIQVGHISHFGLLEMSRQRIRSSVLESSTEKCPHCGGSGHVRSVSSVALQLLRALDEMLMKAATHNLTVRTRSDIALYLLNHKRAHLRALEERFQITIMVNADATIGGQVSFVIERNEQVHSPEQAKALAAAAPVVPAVEDEEEDESVDQAEHEDAISEVDEGGSPAPDEDTTQSDAEQQEQGRRRRRRRRGRRGAEPAEGLPFSPEQNDEVADQETADAVPDSAESLEAAEVESQPVSNGNDPAAESSDPGAAEADHRRRRRGRRGGRRNRRGREGEASVGSEHQPEGDAEIEVAGEFEGGTSDLPDEAAPTALPAGANSLSEHDAPTHPAEWAAHEPHADRLDVERPDVAAPNRGMPRRDATEAGPSSHEQWPANATQNVTPELAEPVPEPTRAEPRRRSTVREPAPVAMRDDTGAAAPPPLAPQPPAEPIVTSSEASDRPRRSGWWSKRALSKG